MHAQAFFEIVPFFVAISWVYAIIWMEEKLAIIFFAITWHMLSAFHFFFAKLLKFIVE